MEQALARSELRLHYQPQLDLATGRIAGMGAQLRLSVKVSPRQLELPGIDTLVGELIQREGLPAGLLQLQVAESALAARSVKVFEALGALRRLGVSLALDRFGTGASSLADLPRVMPDAVRVDRSLVARLPDAADGRALVTAIAALARPLGLKVLADGVETAEQRVFLQGIGVDEIQGHVTGLTMPAEETTQHLFGHMA